MLRTTGLTWLRVRKSLGGRLALQAAETLFDTGGGSAMSRKLAFDRHWRNVRTILNHNPVLLRGRVLGDYYLNGERADFDEGRVF